MTKDNEYKKEYYLKNKGAIKEYKKRYYQNNREKIKARSNEYYRDNIDKVKDYHKNNPEKIREQQNRYKSKRKNTDNIYKLRWGISISIIKQLKKNGESKRNSSCLKFLPYSIQELKEHIEKQFEPWMTWNNWGKYSSETWNDNDSSTWTWNIDHIIPQVDLPYVSMADDNFKKCWSLENLRPYSAKQNIKDKNRLG